MSQTITMNLTIIMMLKWSFVRSQISTKKVLKSRIRTVIFMFRNKNLAPHSPTALPGGLAGEAGEDGWVRGKSELFQKNRHSDVVLVSSKSVDTVISKKDDVVTKKIRKKKQSLPASSKLQCKYCGKKFAAKGFRTHVKACKSKTDESRYTQTTITTSNTNQQ